MWKVFAPFVVFLIFGWVWLWVQAGKPANSNLAESLKNIEQKLTDIDKKLTSHISENEGESNEKQGM